MTLPPVPALLPPWLAGYRRADLTGDVTAGLITAIILVPQAMAYALLAGLPPEVGLYASVAPLVLYALIGTSRTLAVGPVAIASIMTASAIGTLGLATVAETMTAALALAAMVGGILILLGLARAGFLVNFLSHPVLAGFTSAAAVTIAIGQVKTLAGIEVPRSHTLVDGVPALVAALPGFDGPSLILGLGTIALLLLASGPLVRGLTRAGVPAGAAAAIGRAGPLATVVLGILAVRAFDLDARGVTVVGEIPAGLPGLVALPTDPELYRALLPSAVLIALIGYMESVSVAKALASKRRQKIDANRELLALGAANMGSAVTGGYPVAGGFGRSLVNFSAGANTQAAALITAALMVLAVSFLAPAFHDLPRSVLAANIIVAVVKLIDLQTVVASTRASRSDTLAMAVTFLAVLGLGVEAGLLIGILGSMMLFLWRTSRPHTAVLGRVPGTEHFRNIKRHSVETDPRVLILRFDESPFFANAAWLEDRIMQAVADRPRVRHVVLVCSAMNFIDMSALETLEALSRNLREAGVTLHLAEVKGPVMDRLERTAFLRHMAPGRVFLSTHAAACALAEEAEGPAPPSDAAEPAGAAPSGGPAEARS
ncbi:MAG: sulfate permease [Azospirillaceae bacterium]